MKQNIQMLTLVRKDLNLKRDKLLELISKSSMQFILENNESTFVDKLHVNLSHEEIIWLNSQKRKFGWKDDEESLKEVSFKSDINGIPQFKIFDQSLKGTNGEGDSLICLTLGPCDWEEILKVVGKLKLI
jgi:peptidyl-tRNA hydrolase